MGDGSFARLRDDELAAVGSRDEDPELRALEVAILIEEALDVVLPDEVLDASHLGTDAGVTTVVARVTGGG
ncbi:MAG TPA: hypothetical protein VLS51_00810 [Propionibacteriaceae bacterium]|nr:hypothetical protein [Propionibacteriaceae bacterium]